MPDLIHGKGDGTPLRSIRKARVVPGRLEVDVGIEALGGAVDGVEVEQEDLHLDLRRALLGIRAAGVRRCRNRHRGDNRFAKQQPQ